MTWVQNVKEIHRDVVWRIIMKCAYRKREDSQRIWKYSLTLLHSNQEPQVYESKNITVYSSYSTKRFSNSGCRPRSHEVWEILCRFLCDFTKPEALGDVGFTERNVKKKSSGEWVWSIEKIQKATKNYKMWEPMENIIHLYARQNKRI